MNAKDRYSCIFLSLFAYLLFANLFLHFSPDSKAPPPVSEPPTPPSQLMENGHLGPGVLKCFAMYIVPRGRSKHYQMRLNDR